MTRRHRLAFVAIALFTAGCGADGGEALTVSLPVPPPAPVFVGPAKYWCGEWMPRAPQLETALFDLTVRYSGAPTDEDLQRVREAGGTILHVYRLGRVRAVMPVLAVPPFQVAEQVQPDEPLRLAIVVQTDAPLTDAERAYLESIGAEVGYQYPYAGSHWLSAEVDDATIDLIRARAGVLGVDFFGAVPCPIEIGS